MQSVLRNAARRMSTATQSQTHNNNGQKMVAGVFTSSLVAGAFAYNSYNTVEAKEKSKKTDMAYKFVIVGAGIAARSCLKTLNELGKDVDTSGFDGPVLMLGNDPRQNSLGYSDEDHAELEKPSYDERNNILLGHEADSIDVQNKTITLNDGTVVSFDKCFLGLGGKHPALQSVQPSAKDHVTTFRRVADLEKIQAKIDSGEVKDIAVVGGGALGTELALALKAKNKSLQIRQIYAEPGVLHRNLPEYFRAFVTSTIRNLGIVQNNFSLVTDIAYNADKKKVAVKVDSWDEGYYDTDHVIFAPTHIDANNDIAVDAGLEIDQKNSGIIVNSELSAFSDIYVGGDCASYPSPYLGRRRDQIKDHAEKTGVVCAKNMLGQRVVYDYIPQNKMQLKSLGIENNLIGNCDATLDTVGFWQMSKSKRKGKSDDQAFFTSKFSKGVTFYLDNGLVVGILLTNLEDPEEVQRAKNCIMDRVDYADLKGRDLEAELKEKVGFELQLPMIRHTRSKAQDSSSGVSKNKYKKKRAGYGLVARHSTDSIKDAGTNLYWRTA